MLHVFALEEKQQKRQKERLTWETRSPAQQQLTENQPDRRHAAPTPQQITSLPHISHTRTCTQPKIISRSAEVLQEKHQAAKNQRRLLRLQHLSLVHTGNKQAATTHRNSRRVCTCDKQPGRSQRKQSEAQSWQRGLPGPSRAFQEAPGSSSTDLHEFPGQLVSEELLLLLIVDG